MNKRLLKVAAYLGSQGLYKEASLVQKLAARSGQGSGTEPGKYLIKVRSGLSVTDLEEIKNKIITICKDTDVGLKHFKNQFEWPPKDRYTGRPDIFEPAFKIGYGKTEDGKGFILDLLGYSTELDKIHEKLHKLYDSEKTDRLYDRHKIIGIVPLQPDYESDTYEDILYEGIDEDLENDRI
jgi:hypothetical protein